MKNSTRKMFVGCATSACLLFGANVFAQEEAKSEGNNAMLPAFEILDSDQDGKISPEEFLAEFNRMDQNQSTLIEDAEAPSENFIQRLDLDQDTAVSSAEYLELFKLIDKDESGFIESVEYPQLDSSEQTS